MSKMKFKRLEKITNKAIQAMNHGFTPRDKLKRAYMVLKNEELDERDRVALFSYLVNLLLTPEGRRMILQEGHKEEVQDYFRKELGIVWTYFYLNIADDDTGTVDEIKFAAFYLVDEPKPSHL